MQGSIIYSQERWLLFQTIWRQPYDEIEFFPNNFFVCCFYPWLRDNTSFPLLLFLFFFFNHSGIAYRKKKASFQIHFLHLRSLVIEFIEL